MLRQPGNASLLAMDDEELRESAHEWATRTAVEQGLPPKVEDVAILRRVLVLMGVIDASGERVKAL